MTRSFTVATALISRAKFGVAADKSTSVDPGAAVVTSPSSPKYKSSSADPEVANVTTMIRRGDIGHSGEAGVGQAPLHGPDERRGSHVGVRLRHYLSPFTLRAMRSATDRFSRLSWPQNTTASISVPT